MGLGGYYEREGVTPKAFNHKPPTPASARKRSGLKPRKRLSRTAKPNGRRSERASCRDQDLGLRSRASIPNHAGSRLHKRHVETHVGLFSGDPNRDPQFTPSQLSY